MGRAGVGLQQRRQHAHRCRLAGAVGAEQAEHGAGRDLEVDAVERVDVAEGLAQAGDADRRAIAAVRCDRCSHHRQGTHVGVTVISHGSRGRRP